MYCTVRHRWRMTGQALVVVVVTRNLVVVVCLAWLAVTRFTDNTVEVCAWRESGRLRGPRSTCRHPRLDVAVICSRSANPHQTTRQPAGQTPLGARRASPTAHRSEDIVSWSIVEHDLSDQPLRRCLALSCLLTQPHSGQNSVFYSLVITRVIDYLYFANQKAADNIHTQIKADRTQTQT